MHVDIFTSTAPQRIHLSSSNNLNLNTKEVPVHHRSCKCQQQVLGYLVLSTSIRTQALLHLTRTCIQTHGTARRVMDSLNNHNSQKYLGPYHGGGARGVELKIHCWWRSEVSIGCRVIYSKYGIFSNAVDEANKTDLHLSRKGIGS